MPSMHRGRYANICIATLCSRSNFSEADGQRINLMESCGEDRRPRTPRNDPSLNRLVRAQQHRLRDRDSKRLRRFQVDNQLELGWSLGPEDLPVWRLLGSCPRIRPAAPRSTRLAPCDHQNSCRCHQGIDPANATVTPRSSDARASGDASLRPTTRRALCSSRQHRWVAREG